MLRSGGTVVVPTSGLYGLAADACNPEAVQRVITIKRRSALKPVSVLAGSRQQVEQVCAGLDSLTMALMDTFWPGAVTFVVPAAQTVPRALLGGGSTIGVRLVAHGLTETLLKRLGRPVTGTSANISGCPAVDRIEAIDRELARAVDMILDAGPLPAKGPSTVVAVQDGVARIIRPGRVSAEQILARAESLRKLG